MSALATLLQYANAGGGGGGTITHHNLVVYHTSVDNGNNGGCCCAWTVPTGVTWFSVEMWGGGGGGAGACCCFQGWPGGSGTYTRKIVQHPTPGTSLETRVYRICAGGTTGCVDRTCIGCKGCPSYIYGESETANVVCAEGGLAGGSKCYFGNNCNYNGCASIQCGSYCGTMGICGVGGAGKGNASCHQGSYTHVPSAPMTGGNFRQGKDFCSSMCHGCHAAGYAHFPGGGGATATNHGDWNPAYGNPGAGGLVVIHWTQVG